MTKNIPVDQAALRTIFAECRQCGTCCKSYRKITLQPDEVAFIRKMGGHVGVNVNLNDLRDKTMDQLVSEAEATGKVFMIHPDDKGCLFLQKKMTSTVAASTITDHGPVGGSVATLPIRVFLICSAVPTPCISWGRTVLDCP